MNSQQSPADYLNRAASLICCAQTADALPCHSRMWDSIMISQLIQTFDTRQNTKYKSLGHSPLTYLRGNGTKIGVEKSSADQSNMTDMRKDHRYLLGIQRENISLPYFDVAANKTVSNQLDISSIIFREKVMAKEFPAFPAYRVKVTCKSLEKMFRQMDSKSSSLGERDLSKICTKSYLSVSSKLKQQRRT